MQRCAEKCPERAVPEGPEEANTWSCTELFPSACARVGAELPSRFGFRAGARLRAEEAVRALRGVPAEMGDGETPSVFRSREETSSRTSKELKTMEGSVALRV